jgi:hypothetical protein
MLKTYTAIPLKDGNPPSSPRIDTHPLETSAGNTHLLNSRRKEIYFGFACCIAILLLGFAFDDEFNNNNNREEMDFTLLRGPSKSIQNDISKKDKTIDFFPTLSPGGGRDWTLNLEEGTISPKHDDSFVLGSYPNAPLVLTNKGDPNQITFPKDQLEALTKGESTSLSGIGFQYPDEELKIYDVYYYKEATGGLTDSSLTVEYLDSNFITWRDGKGHDLVLDIAFGIQEKGNSVNFVSVKDEDASKNAPWWKQWFQPKTFQYGGGRDWVIDPEDGTISSKHSPDLVLGYGPLNLMLTEKGSSSAATFENLEALASGETTKLVFASGTQAVGKLQSEEQHFGPFRYIEGCIVSQNDAVPVKFIDNNYIATAEEGVPQEKALVLDVSFWKYYSTNHVNFVGGQTWEATDDDDN